MPYVSGLMLLVCLVLQVNQLRAGLESLTQGMTVSGTVTAMSNGETLPGVNVIIKGTNIGTITDVSGHYTLNVLNPDDILIFSSIGFITEEIPVNGRSVVDISMAEDIQSLEEVVVVGYGTQKKVSVTAAISDVPVKNIQRISTPSLSTALAGSMPGIVTRQSSGEPGYDGAAIFIRGFGTWKNREPLILVDGVERSLNNLNTQEIESFSILKDASATAVYGVRGANGVILINTKRGKAGKPKVIFRTENAMLTALRLPEYVSGPEYVTLVNEATRNEDKPPYFTAEDVQKYNDGTDPYLYPNVNWVDEVLKKNTFQTINNLSVTGGSDIIQYYTNVGYTVQNGIYKQDPDNYWNNNAQMQRYNFRSNVDIQLSKIVKIDLGIGGIIQRGNYPGRGMPEIFHAFKITNPIAFPVTNPDGSVSGNPAFARNDNPYALVSRSGYSTQDRNTLQGTFGGDLDLSTLVTEGLSLRGLFAYDHYYVGYNDRRKPYALRQYLGSDALGNDIYREPDILEESAMTYGTASNANRSYYSEAAVDYNRTFNKHTVGAMGLYNQRDFVDVTAGSSLFNLPYRRRGFAGRLTYDFDNRYLVEGNMGYNGSENFPKGKRYGFFPSVSIGWVISNEAFWGVRAINHLKLRGSHGQVGNDHIGGERFLFRTTIERGGQEYWFGGGTHPTPVTGYNEQQTGNENVTWEVATKSNFGFDLEMFDGRILLQVDGFNEYRKGILIERQVIPRVAGYYPWILPYGNLGEAQNEGVDALLEIKNTTKRGLYYNFRGSFTYARSIRKKDDFPEFLYPYQNQVGKPIDQPFGLVSLGLFESEEEIQISPRQTFVEEVRPGDIKYMDVNGDGVIDKFDEVPIGFPRTPEITYGISMAVAYKNFDASVFFTGVARASVFIDREGMYPFIEGLATDNVLKEYYDNRWSPDNPDPNALYPRVPTMDNKNNYRPSTHYLRDASFLRLKSAEIGYNFKKVNAIGINEIRVFVNGANLITWDKIKIMDPESDYGIGSYPLQRIVNLGAQFTF